MSITSKTKTLIWYLSRPKYYGQLINLIKSKIISESKENTRVESEAWCQQNAIGTRSAIKHITGNVAEKIETLYSDTFLKAKQISQNIPVKMGGGGDTNLLFHLCEYVKAKQVIETGVAHGWSSLALLLSLSKRQGSKLVSTDMPYAKMGNEDFVGCIVPDESRSIWELIRLPDQSGLPIALKKFTSIDLCHYDSDKTYNGRMWAYPKLWTKLRKGGVFISDDIGDNIAFKEFADGLGIDPVVVRFKTQYIGILIKSDD